MKSSPKIQKLEEVLRSSNIAAGGFLGSDGRPLEEIIEADIHTAKHLGFGCHQIAQRMQQITDTAISRLGQQVEIDENIIASVDEWKGQVVCPWPHRGRFAKRITRVKNLKNNRQIVWSDLNIHLIAEHNFFEGVGSMFRLEPAELIKIIF